MGSNPFSNIITTKMGTLYNQGIDEVIRACQSTVELVTGTEWQTCTECSSSNPVGDKGTSVFYPHGGYSRQHGAGGPCVNCNGTQKVQVDTTENINMAVDFSNVEWEKTESNVMVPIGIIKCISNIDTLDNIKQAKRAVMSTELQHITRITAVLDGPPEPIGFKEPKNFVLSFWKPA